MSSAAPDAAEAMRERLQTDLRAALKGRVALDVSVLRGLIAAIDNAGAVPLPSGSGPRQSEVERRRLSEEDVQAVVRREYDTHQAAATEFARLCQDAKSEQANHSLTIVSRYLVAIAG